MPQFIIAQIIGAGAAGFSALSFQGKSSKSVVTMQFIGNVLWVLHYLLLGGVMGVIMNLICGVRSFIYSKKDKWSFAKHKGMPYIFVGLAAVCYVLTFTIGSVPFTFPKAFFEIMPVMALITSTFVFNMKDVSKVRKYSALFTSPFWMTYNIFTISIPGIICEGAAIISIIIAMIRYRKR